MFKSILKCATFFSQVYWSYFVEPINQTLRLILTTLKQKKNIFFVSTWFHLCILDRHKICHPSSVYEIPFIFYCTSVTHINSNELTDNHNSFYVQFYSVCTCLEIIPVLVAFQREQFCHVWNELCPCRNVRLNSVPFTG